MGRSPLRYATRLKIEEPLLSMAISSGPRQRRVALSLRVVLNFSTWTSDRLVASQVTPMSVGLR